jgi:hypothetical protein
MSLGRRGSHLRGDVYGHETRTTVQKIQGKAVAATAPSDGQVLQWVNANSQYEPSTLSSGLTTEQVQDIVGAMVAAGTGVSVSYDDPGGTLTISSTVAGGEDDRLVRVAQLIPRARDSSINFPGLAATPSVNGTQSQNNGSTGSFHKRTTAATTGQVASWGQSSLDTLHRQFSSDVTFKVRTDADITNIRIWVGLNSATMHGSSAGLGHLAAFRYATDVDGTAFWRCVTRDNTTDNTTVSALAIATTTTYLLRIVESASDVKFYYHDGSAWQLLATHIANLPGSTEDTWFNVSATTLENVAKAISLGYIHIRYK